MPAEKKTVTYRSEGCSSDSADALLSRNVLDQRAQIHFDKGQNYVHPKITIWKPKYRKAAEEYCQAARFHHLAGSEEAALNDLLLALDCFEKKRNWFPAAKTLEQVVVLTLKKKRCDHDRQLLRDRTLHAASLFRKSGHPDSAASLLEKVAKAVEAEDITCTIFLLERAAETVENESRPFQAACYTSRLLAMALASNDLKSAIKRTNKLVSLYQEGGHKPYTGRYCLTLVLILIADRRYHEAEVMAHEYGNYCSKEQNQVIETLLQGLHRDDSEIVQTALEHQCLKSIDESVRRLVDQIRGAIATTPSETTSATDPTGDADADDMSKTNDDATSAEATAASDSCTEEAAVNISTDPDNPEASLINLPPTPPPPTLLPDTQLAPPTPRIDTQTPSDTSAETGSLATQPADDDLLLRNVHQNSNPSSSDTAVKCDAGVQAALSRQTSTISRQTSTMVTPNYLFRQNSYDAGDEPACKMLDKRLNRKHLFKRNMTVAELPGGDGQPQGDVDGESQGLMRRMRSQSGHAGTATLASPTHLVPGRFKSHFSSPVGDNSAYQTVALGAMAGAGALLLHEMNKGRVKIEDRLVLEGEALDNDELMLDAEDSGNFD